MGECIMATMQFQHPKHQVSPNPMLLNWIANHHILSEEVGTLVERATTRSQSFSIFTRNSINYQYKLSLGLKGLASTASVIFGPKCSLPVVFTPPHPMHLLKSYPSLRYVVTALHNH